MSDPESDLEDRSERQVAASIAVFVLLTLSMLATVCEAAVASPVACVGFGVLTLLLCGLFISIRAPRG